MHTLASRDTSYWSASAASATSFSVGTLQPHVYMNCKNALNTSESTPWMVMLGCRLSSMPAQHTAARGARWEDSLVGALVYGGSAAQTRRRCMPAALTIRVRHENDVCVRGEQNPLFSPGSKTAFICHSWKDGIPQLHRYICAHELALRIGCT